MLKSLIIWRNSVLRFFNRCSLFLSQAHSHKGSCHPDLHLADRGRRVSNVRCRGHRRKRRPCSFRPDSATRRRRLESLDTPREGQVGECHRKFCHVQESKAMGERKIRGGFWHRGNPAAHVEHGDTQASSVGRRNRPVGRSSPACSPVTTSATTICNADVHSSACGSM